MAARHPSLNNGVCVRLHSNELSDIAIRPQCTPRHGQEVSSKRLRLGCAFPYLYIKSARWARPPRREDEWVSQSPLGGVSSMQRSDFFQNGHAAAPISCFDAEARAAFPDH
jgi:hypothetical protein